MAAESSDVNVFISYSRADLAFVDQLVVALKRLGYTPVIDREGISPGAEWRSGLSDLILASDTVVFVLSPDFIASDICQWEVEETERLGKRLVPLLCRGLEDKSAPTQLEKLNYIHFYEDPKIPGSGFGTGLANLDDALSIDLDWIREHTRLGELAARWNKRSRPDALLIHGTEFFDFQEWRKQTPPRGAELSELQAEFLRESEIAEKKRVSAERLKIEAMNVALRDREDALAREATAQRALRRNSLISIAAGALLTIIAGMIGIIALGKSADADQKSSTIFASQSKELNENANFDKAMLFSLQGDPDGPWRLFGKKENHLATAQFIRGFLNSKLITTYERHTDGVATLAHCPDGTCFVSGSGDNTAILWDIDTKNAIHIFEGHSRRITSVSFSPDGNTILTSSGDSTLKLWNINTGKLIRSFQGHETWVNDAKFSKDGTKILSGGGDKLALIWETSTGKILGRLTGHEGRVSAVAFSADETMVYTGCEYGTIKTWDADSYEIQQTIQAHDNWINALNVSADGEKLLTASGDSTAKVWLTDSFELAQTYKGHNTRINAAKFSDDGRYALTGSGDFSAHLWRVDTGKTTMRFAGHDSWVYGVDFSPDGRSILTGAWDNTIKRWSVPAEKQTIAVIHNNDTMTATAISPDGQLFFANTGTQGGEIRDAHAHVVATLSAHEGRIMDAVFGQNGHTIATASSDGTAKLWDAKTGSLLKNFSGHENVVRAVAIGPSGKRLMTGGNDQHAIIWDIETVQPIATLIGHEDRINTVAFSPDGKKVYTGSADATLMVWDAYTGELENTIEESDTRFHKIAIGKKGQFAAAALGANDAVLWNLKTGKVERTFSGHNAWVYDIAFSPDDRYMLTASRDGDVMLWDVATGESLKQFNDHTDRINALDFSADGLRFATASSDGTTRLWQLNDIIQLNLDQQIQMACERVRQTGVESFTEFDHQRFGILTENVQKPCDTLTTK